MNKTDVGWSNFKSAVFKKERSFTNNFEETIL